MEIIKYYSKVSFLHLKRLTFDLVNSLKKKEYASQGKLVKVD